MILFYDIQQLFRYLCFFLSFFIFFIFEPLEYLRVSKNTWKREFSQIKTNDNFFLKKNFLKNSFQLPQQESLFPIYSYTSRSVLSKKKHLDKSTVNVNRNNSCTLWWQYLEQNIRKQGTWKSSGSLLLGRGGPCIYNRSFEKAAMQWKNSLFIGSLREYSSQ